VNTRIRQKLARHKKRIQKRLDKKNLGGCSRPMFTASNIKYEIGERGSRKLRSLLPRSRSIAVMVGFVGAFLGDVDVGGLLWCQLG
jgi:hypothetical protein